MTCEHPAGPRSIALVGPQGAGKSTLFDALMAAAGEPVRRPRADRGEARGEARSEIRLGHCAFMGERWSILDCAGSIEFAFETEAALTAVDLAVVVVEPSAARLGALEPLMRSLEAHRLPHLVFVNKIDQLDGSFDALLHALQGASARRIAPRQLPMRAGDAVIGYVDVVTGRAFRYGERDAAQPIELPEALRDDERKAHEELTEALADQDDALLEKILEDVEPGADELYAHISKDQSGDQIVEALIGQANRGHGVFRLWKALRHDAPPAAETARRRGLAGEGEGQPDEAPAVQIFKTAQGGRLCFGRVWRGVLRDGATLGQVGAGQGGGAGQVRVGGLYRFAGADQTRASEAQAGEVVALGRLEGVGAGDLLGGLAQDAAPFPRPPEPVYELAVAPKDRKDDVKLSTALTKLAQDDPSLSVEHRAETGETVMRGQGELHLSAAIERLAAVHNVEVAVATPSIAYKETIRRAVSQHGRLKRQTGGHGQFADVKIEVEPRPRGVGFAFLDKTVGGSVPKNFIPAVREAAEEAMRKGPLGYPVVDVAVTLVDGGFHSVDSSDMAFRAATKAAVAEALAKADPVLLEPVDHVVVSAPNAFTAAVQKLLSGRRGQIMGYHEKPGWPGWDDVEALAPEAELHDLIMELRSDTMGLGAYRRRFDHLSEARR
ncbi:elongation factor G [Methylocella sp.]|uniref:elongation factor G n=1 Tax=Methylocella sp. TaxID=1978226 RepID=UPI003783712C